MMRTHTAAALACDTDDLSPIPPAAWVLDTNIVLDLWVFDDPATQPLRQALGIPSGAQGQAAEALSAPLHPPWLSTPVMREELARVLAYPHLVRRPGGVGRLRPLCDCVRTCVQSALRLS
jgi:hypothetical protein